MSEGCSTQITHGLAGVIQKLLKNMKENTLRAWSHARVCDEDARMLNSRSHQFSPKLHLLSRWTETKRPETEAGFVQDFARETGSSGKLGEALQ